MSRRAVANPLALAVLACLWERPMYPYEITTTLRERAKDESIRLNFGSLYAVIRSLEKHSFVEQVRVEREGNRPERVVYGITTAGRAEADDWLREILSVPVKEYPALESGLSLVGMVPPGEAHDLLALRVDALDAEIDSVRAGLAESAAWGLPEVFAVEADYRLAMLRAERDWVAGLVARLAVGDVGGQAMWARMHERLAAGAPAEEVQRELEQHIGAAVEAARRRGGPASSRGRRSLALS